MTSFQPKALPSDICVVPTEGGLPLLLSTVSKHYTQADLEAIEKAFEFARIHHGDQKRASGGPYYEHPLEVAQILADMKLDPSTIITALLHDTVEDTPATLADVEREFGSDIAKLVDGVTKLTKIELQSESSKQAENFRKLVLAISEDIRVLLVKLADRVHNMRTLHFIEKPEKRARIAAETMDIFAPLAERIGVKKFKDELQDLAFQQIHPEGYSSIANRLEYLRSNGGEIVEETIVALKKTLSDNGVQAEVRGREKQPYSIWCKMEYRNVSFEQMTDIMGFRVIVDSIGACYHALGIIHSAYQMVPDRFKDFISTPKENGYKSLHTVVIGPHHQRIEVQIRTREMHEIAEFGVAAHWAYKQNSSTEGTQYRWIRQLLEIVENAPTPEEFLENTKMEMFHDQVFCFTPQGRLIALPREATPVDFAFAVHSNIGYTCVGAKVNGRIVPLRTKLNNGDQVEIIRSKSQRPSPAWEKFVVTGKARSEIRRFIRQQQHTEYVTLGRNILQKAFKEQHLEFSEKILSEALDSLHKKSLDELLSAVGEGSLSRVEVVKACYPDASVGSNKKSSLLQKLRGKKADDASESAKAKFSLPIVGLIPGMAVHYAGCCHPLPGESILGIINTGKGVTIHTVDCHELENLVDEPERWIEVSWDDNTREDLYVGRLKAVLAHEAGSLGTLANTIAKAGGNISNLRIDTRSNEYFELMLDVEVKDIKHLASVMASLRSQPVIYSVERFTSA